MDEKRKVSYSEIVKFAVDECGIDKYYPDFKLWLQSKYFSGEYIERRNIFVQRNESGKLIGIALTKNFPDDKKLCTLLVHKDYRRKGLGFKLLSYLKQKV